MNESIYDPDMILANIYGFGLNKSRSGYSLEEVFRLAGRYDYTSTITIRPNSDTENKYGSELVISFKYTQKEREEMERRFNENLDGTYGFVKAECLDEDMSEERKEMLSTIGIESVNIVEILYLPFTKKENTHLSKEIRNINLLKVEVKSLPKGGDLEWIYESLKRSKEANIPLTPESNATYLAYKCIIEPNLLSDIEKKQIYKFGSNMYPEVEYVYLKYKQDREQINSEEIARLAVLSMNRNAERMLLLNKHLEDAGSSVEKLKKSHPSILDHITKSILQFYEKQYNCSGLYPLYLDLNGFLHIFLRHAIEFQFSKNFEIKDKFQLKEADIGTVMKYILFDINNEYQAYKTKNPKSKYGKYGAQSYYYNGDYYTIRVNEDGCIGTFYKNGLAKKSPTK